MKKTGGGGVASSVVAATLILTVAGCDFGEILDVDTPGTLTVDRLQGPENVQLMLSGIPGAYHFAFDNHVRYTGLFTDEFILAGTFPTRREVDERAVQAGNATVTGDAYTPLNRAIFHADTVAVQFAAELDNPEYAAVRGNLNVGVAAGPLYAGFARTHIAEFWCQSPIRISAALSSDEIMEQAIGRFDDAIAQVERAEAERTAGTLALTTAQRNQLRSIWNAAQVGKARALLWLRRDAEAAAAAALVDEGFERYAEYSAANTTLYNDVYTFTYGVTQVIRWTVGDGTSADRHNEEWPYFDEWVDLGLIEPRPAGFTSFNAQIPVNLQLKYGQPGSNILMASRTEADLIIAEGAIRSGDTDTADEIINGFRGGWGLGDLTFAGMTTEQALVELARERARELWLTGERQNTLRRFYERDGIDLYPEKPGDQICLPIPQQEIDNNPNL